MLSTKRLLIILGIAVLTNSIGLFLVSRLQLPTQTPEIPVQSMESISPAQPNPDKDAYETVLKEAVAKCGDTVDLVMILDDIHAADAHGNAYFFTPGTCGRGDQVLELFYETRLPRYPRNCFSSQIRVHHHASGHHIDGRVELKQISGTAVI